MEKIEQERGSLYMVLGQSYVENGDYQKAIEMFEKAIAIIPKDVKLNLTLADLYRDKGMVKEAVDQYRKVIELSPGTEEADKAEKGINKLKGKI